MNYAQMFASVEEHCPSDPSINNDFNSYQPRVMEYHQLPPGAIAESYQMNATRPPLYNLDGYISPYAYDNWGASTKFLSFLNEESNLPIVENKLDPNKIFNADIAALKTSAADQLKITRAFERKLLASLASKENAELTENDIQAMQAITASRNTMIAASNGQVTIKKNIADIRIKQAQNKAVSGGIPGVNTTSNSFDAYGIGLNQLHGLTEIPMESLLQSNNDLGIEIMSAEDAGTLINSISSISNNDVEWENQGAQTYVVPGPDGGHMYETYDRNDNLIPNYPNPTSPIVRVDIESGLAYAESMEDYPLRL